MPEVFPLTKHFDIRDGIDLFGRDILLRVDAIKAAFHSVAIDAEESPDDDGTKKSAN